MSQQCGPIHVVMAQPSGFYQASLRGCQPVWSGTGVLWVPVCCAAAAAAAATAASLSAAAIATSMFDDDGD